MSIIWHIWCSYIFNVNLEYPGANQALMFHKIFPVKYMNHFEYIINLFNLIKTKGILDDIA